MTDVTRILSAIEQGDPQAAEQLLPLVYDELRKLAAQKLAQEKPGPDAPGHRPGPRGLPAAGGRGARPEHWNSRGHFFAAAAEAMRRILVENARRKRGRQARRRPAPRSTSTADAARRADPRRPARPRRGPRRGWPSDDPAAAELVKLRYFAGLTIERGGRGPGHLRGDRRPALGLRPGLAAPHG